MASTVKFFGKDPLYFAIPASFMFHLGLWAMNFDFEKPMGPRAKALDITLVNFQNSQAPEKEDYLANNNQLGSGSKEKKGRITSRAAADVTNDKMGEDFFTNKKVAAKITPKLTPEILTTKGKTNKFINKNPEKQEKTDPVVNINSTDQAEEIAKLMAEMSQQEERYAKRPRIRFIDSLAAKGTVEAEYIHNWSKKLERIGNINFPKAAIRLKLSGTLMLNATLDRAGRVTEIQVTTSSGSKILDNAAIRIVKLAAPYEPLPTKIRAKYDRLNITRTIVFHRGSDNTTKFYSK